MPRKKKVKKLPAKNNLTEEETYKNLRRQRLKGSVASRIKNHKRTTNI